MKHKYGTSAVVVLEKAQEMNYYNYYATCTIIKVISISMERP